MIPPVSVDNQPSKAFLLLFDAPAQAVATMVTIPVAKGAEDQKLLNCASSLRPKITLNIKSIRIELARAGKFLPRLLPLTKTPPGDLSDKRA